MSAAANPRTTSNPVTVAAASLVTLAIAGLLLMGPLHADRNLVDPELLKADPAGALQALTGTQRVALEARENQRLQKEPLDLSALTNLTLLNELAGKTDVAQAYSRAAADRSLRDPVTQLAAIAAYLRTKEYPKAFYHLDGLLSGRPDMRPKLYASLASVFSDEKAVAALADVLNRRPSWRTEFAFWLIGADKSGRTAFSLFNAMRKAGGAADASEIRALVDQQVKQHNLDQAYIYWLDSLTPSELVKLGNLFDGAFELEAKSQYFGWNMYDTPNAEARLVARNDPNKSRELRLAFYDNTGEFNNVYQVVHLRPGAYTLSGEWSSSRLNTPAGLSWTFTCVESGVLLGKTDAFAQASPHAAFSLALTVPDQNCGFQILRLSNASTAALDAKIDGDLEFSKMAITAQN